MRLESPFDLLKLLGLTPGSNSSTGKAGAEHIKTHSIKFPRRHGHGGNLRLGGRELGELTLGPPQRAPEADLVLSQRASSRSLSLSSRRSEPTPSAPSATCSTATSASSSSKRSSTRCVLSLPLHVSRLLGADAFPAARRRPLGNLARPPQRAQRRRDRERPVRRRRQARPDRRQRAIFCRPGASPRRPSPRASQAYSRTLKGALIPPGAAVDRLELGKVKWVLVVEKDVRRPSSSRLFRLALTPSLAGRLPVARLVKPSGRRRARRRRPPHGQGLPGLGDARAPQAPLGRRPLVRLVSLSLSLVHRGRP